MSTDLAVRVLSVRSERKRPIHPQPELAVFRESSPTLESMLEEKEQFTIPKYQRGYSWRMTQGIELFEDIQACASGGEDDALFLGTCIIKKSKDSSEIVDGQQRVTTLVLLLVACRTRAIELGHTGTAHEISARITSIDRRGRSHGPKLIASPTINDVFATVCSTDWDGEFSDRVGKKQVRRQRKLVEPIYSFFIRELRKLSEDEFFRFLDATYESRFIRIDVEETINALSIFERTNARGVELEVADLLKNYLFQTESEDVEERWEQISLLADGQLQRMLKYAYVSRKGAVRKRELYSKLKALVRERTPEVFLDDLLVFGQFFQLMRSGNLAATLEFFEQINCEKMSRDQNNAEAFHLSISALRDFQILQPIPVIFAAIQCMLRLDPEQYKPLLRLVAAMERYHFVNNIICTRIGNEVEKLYADACAHFSASKDFNASVDKLVVALQKQRAAKDEFVEQFADLEYSSSNIPWIAYFYDRVQNHGKRPGSRLTIYDSENKQLRRRKFDIEHFAPRNPPAPHAPDLARRIDNIGNLLVLSEQTNKKLQNKDPFAKTALLQAAPDSKKFDFVGEFLAYLESRGGLWDASAIEQRSRALGAHAYETAFSF